VNEFNRAQDEVSNVIKHTEIQYRLKQMLVSSNIPESHVHSEKPIYPPMSAGSGRADIVWEFENTGHEAKGIAFEIKTDSIKHYRYTGLRQLHDSALCGFYPALVCRRSVYEDDSGSASSFEELIHPIGGIYVEMTEDPLSFEIINDWILRDIDIPEFLKSPEE